MKCPKCANDQINKKGWIKTKKNPKPIRQYQCKACKHRFTVNSHKTSKLQKKPELNKKIMELYCEGNTLRGMARILKVNYKTVDRKFRYMANLAREQHLKAMDCKDIVTKYVQVDEMHSFEHTKQRPLGIQLSVRPKTGQILAARVCRIPINALAMPRKKKIAYNLLSTRKQAMTDMLLETAKALNEGYSVISCDGSQELIMMSKIICEKSLIETHVNQYAGMWRLNHTCAKMRHHVSRLTRKTWATTKKMERLQMHLDLFIAYQNQYNLD